MTKEQSYFLRIISDHIKGDVTKPEADLNWSIILEYAKNHQLNSIVYYQCKSFIPAEYKAALNKQYSSAVFYYTNRVMCMKKIEQEFSKHGIAFFTVKGLDAAAYYPQPALRTMGDSDIVVHLSDKEKAGKLLLDMGFENQSHGGFEWVYFKNDLEFELHHDLLYDQPSNPSELTEYFKGAWDFTKQGNNTLKSSLDSSFHFLYLLVHLRKHFVYCGVGIRQFVDLVVMCQKADLNIEWLQSQLDQLNLSGFASMCMGICERWFDMKLPFAKPLDDDFFELSTDKIFCNGVFGTQDKENANTLTHYSVTKKGRASVLLSYIFPSYKNVKDAEYYSYVNHKPYLLPVVWIHRVVRLLVKGADDSQKNHAIAIFDGEQSKKYDEFFKKWGL